MNIYFSGIGGVGIGPLAEIALDAGYEIQGSDIAESPLVVQLRERGVPIALSQDGNFLTACHEAKPIDLFVHTAALTPGHDELVTAQTLGIRTAKRDELLALLLREKNLKLVAIAGTHGKTTTTGMMIWTMQQLGIPVSYSVGTTLSFGPSGHYDPNSEYFVYECDEFDRNFLHFSPHVSLITSVDYDHPDTYPTEDDYQQAFHQFARQSEHVIAWAADCLEIATESRSSWVLQNGEAAPVALAGAHNRRNATLVIKAIEYLDMGSPERAESILGAFPGTSRRFECLADNLYSDYGHHPVEIAATLAMAREVNDRVVLVYQPHQNTRQHEVRAQYTACFEQAETVYWLPTYLSREDPTLPILTPSELTANVTNREAIRIADLDDTLWSAIEKARATGALVLFMGAGTVDAWVRERLA